MKTSAVTLFLLLYSINGISQNELCTDSLKLMQVKFDILKKEKESLESDVQELLKNPDNSGDNVLSRLEKYDSPIIKGFIITTENDFFGIGPNLDESYTGHFRFDFFLNGRLSTPGWKKRNEESHFHFPFVRNTTNIEYNLESVFINGQGYTPSRANFDKTEVVEDDRPYASYISVGYQRTALFPKWLNTSELHMGFMGTNGANSIQNFLHARITTRSDSVLGWRNQIAHPGKFVLNYRNFGTRMLGENRGYMNSQEHPCKMNLGINYDLNLGGFMTYVQTGLNVFNSTSIFANLGTPYAVGTSKERAFEFGYRVNLDTRFVIWNSTLAGLARNDQSVYKIPAADIRRLVFIPSVRVMLIYNGKEKNKRRFIFSYQTHLRTKEYDGGKGIHTWGTFTVGTFKK